jgi:hypothetical protein
MSNINLSVYKDAGFSTTQMRSLESFLASNPSIHWIKLNEQIGIYDLVLDNQMFSTFRSCPSYFIEAYVNGYVPKGEGGRVWFLDFGIVFHKMIELYYTHFRESSFNIQDWAFKTLIEEWNKAEMDYHSEHKEYKAIGGLMGFAGLLIAYATRYAPDNERLRVIGTEISFGHAKEVRLGHIGASQYEMESSAGGRYTVTTDIWLNCYLSGRIDVLVDDGKSICPLDHKTMASFRFDPSLRFETDEGPTGYIYAVNQILSSFIQSKSLDPSLMRRDCNKIIMNFISKSIPKEGERFKRMPVMKTTEQLESYRLRMLSTAEDIFRAMIRYTSTGVATRDTSKCTNWFMKECLYLPAHRQNSKANEFMILNTFFEKKDIWNTEEV